MKIETLEKIFPEDFPGCGVAVVDTKHLSRHKKRIEAVFTNRFWPRHPFLRFFAFFIPSFFTLMIAEVIARISSGILPCVIAAAFFAVPLAAFFALAVWGDTGINWRNNLLSDYISQHGGEAIPQKAHLCADRIREAGKGDEYYAIFVEHCSLCAADVTFITLWHKGRRLCFGTWGCCGEPKLDAKLAKLASNLERETSA